MTTGAGNARESSYKKTAGGQTAWLGATNGSTVTPGTTFKPTSSIDANGRTTMSGSSMTGAMAGAKTGRTTLTASMKMTTTTRMTTAGKTIMTGTI